MLFYSFYLFEILILAIIPIFISPSFSKLTSTKKVVPLDAYVPMESILDIFPVYVFDVSAVNVIVTS